MLLILLQVVELHALILILIKMNLDQLHRTRDPDTVGIEYICSTVEEFQTSRESR